jgi:biopolymer transport protein ExbB
MMAKNNLTTELDPAAVRPQHVLRFRLALLALLALCLVAAPMLITAQAQDTAGPTTDVTDNESDGSTPALDTPQTDGFFTLLVKGGVFMIPILMMSILVVTFVVERFLGLRRSRVLPGELVDELGDLGASPSGFDPRKAYRICQQYPSSAATVIQAMLLKVGRPHSEVEHTVGETSSREANRLYANVRWLNLASAVSPLLGLFGTVWGMIRAFQTTAALAPGQDKAIYLAEGIYVALVTTLGGLAVAVPAAIFAHYFEGRIQSLFYQIDELLFHLMPQIERYEGRVRFSNQSGEGEESKEAVAQAE